MDSNHELDRFFEVLQLTDSTKSLKSSKASKARSRYKIGTKCFPIESVRRVAASLVGQSAQPIGFTIGLSIAPMVGESAPVYTPVTRRSTAIRVSITPSLGIMGRTTTPRWQSPPTGEKRISTSTTSVNFAPAVSGHWSAFACGKDGVIVVRNQAATTRLRPARYQRS